jgi:hypothetical protein
MAMTVASAAPPAVMAAEVARHASAAEIAASEGAAMSAGKSAAMTTGEAASSAVTAAKLRGFSRWSERRQRQRCAKCSQRAYIFFHLEPLCFRAEFEFSNSLGVVRRLFVHEQRSALSKVADLSKQRAEARRNAIGFNRSIQDWRGFRPVH